MSEPERGSWGDVFGWDDAGRQSPRGEPTKGAVQSAAEEIVLPYAPSPVMVVLTVPVLLLTAVFLWHTGETNDRGLVIEGIIHLSVENASRFYYGCAVACVVCAIIIIVLVIPQLFIKRRIAMTNQAITLPGWGWSRAHYTVPAGDIVAMKLTTMKKYVFLKIYARDGRRYSINSHWLPNHEDVATIVNWVRERAGITADGSSGPWQYPG